MFTIGIIMLVIIVMIRMERSLIIGFGSEVVGHLPFHSTHCNIIVIIIIIITITITISITISITIIISNCPSLLNALHSANVSKFSA